LIEEMKGLVIYYSETGDAEKVVEAIVEGLGTTENRIGDEEAEFVVIRGS